MTIHVDDAGWGCLLGGVLIGAYRLETEEYVWQEVPVEFFQGAAFARKEYLGEVARVVERLLDQLNVPKDEPIQICTRYVLQGAREFLARNRYCWQTAKITGPLQQRAETTLLEKMHALGLAELNYETLTTRQGLLFWLCLRWLKGGDINATCAVPEREKQAKTGWANYRIWVNHPYSQAKQLTQKGRKRRKR